MTTVTMAEVVVRTMVTLHPWDCHCCACDPYCPRGSSSAGPSQMLCTFLADGEEPPPGWKRAGVRSNTVLP
jgi:hypothetical protein